MAVPAAHGVAHPVLLAALADGRVHSGTTLAQTLGVSDTAIQEEVERLCARGIEISALPRGGYQLAGPVELLDACRIRDFLGPTVVMQLAALEICFEVDSTNTRLLASPPPPPGRARVLISELQHAGRGRRGRRWIAPFGGSLTLSIGWAGSRAARADPSLSLGIGVAVARALKRCGAEGISLKWPNDICFADRKIGGVLLEARAEAGGPVYVVIGIGINVALAADARRHIESGADAAGSLAIAAVGDACATGPPSRNLLAGAILDEVLSMLPHFERHGFAPLQPAWAALDGLLGRAATVSVGGTTVTGLVRGVDLQGALLLERAGEIRRFISGEVSLRLMKGAD